MPLLSIFHDSVFYCLYESFYPTFLLDLRPLAADVFLVLRYIISRIHFYHRL